MIECKKCKLLFSTSIRIEGIKRVLGSRKYCLTCSPFGGKNTKKLELASSSIVEGSEVVCSSCSKNYTYLRKKGHSKGTCNSCWTKKKRKEQKAKAVLYMGGKCSRCGYDKCNNALDFHHRNEKEKEFNISSNNYKPWETVKLELDKCILLCANCHREIHAKS